MYYAVEKVLSAAIGNLLIVSMTVGFLQRHKPGEWVYSPLISQDNKTAAEKNYISKSVNLLLPYFTFTAAAAYYYFYY